MGVPDQSKGEIVAAAVELRGGAATGKAKAAGRSPRHAAQGIEAKSESRIISAAPRPWTQAEIFYKHAFCAI